MKVGVIYYKYPLYPQGSYFQEFLNRLACSVERIYLVASRYPKGGFERPDNLKIFWVPMLPISYLGELFFMIVALLRVMITQELHRVDVVNSVGSRGLLAGWYLKWRYGIPLVCTIEIVAEKGSVADKVYYKVIRFLSTKVPIDKFICWSTYYWENHLRGWGISRSKVAFVTGGIDTKRYAPTVTGVDIKRRYSPRDPLIVFAKPLHDYNTESAKILVRSVALLRPDVRVRVLVGGGDGQLEVQKLAEDLGVTDQVAFMPPTPFPEIPKYIAAADLIVLPFVYAPTTSRSLLEAMAMGKPIITVPVGEAPKILENGESVVFVKPEPEEVARAVKLLLDDKVFAEKLGIGARRRIEKSFSLTRVVDQTVGYFEALLS